MEEYSFNLNSQNVILDAKRQKIYEGLKQIGEEISAFYLDGVKIYKSNLATKTYLLAHIAREIEGSIRDIFASDVKKEKARCSRCGRTIEKTNHIDEICAVLDLSKDSKFVKEWHRIAKEFHKFAHRHGAWKKPRTNEEFSDLWEKFEIILFKLVGEYLNLNKLIDKMLKVETPTNEILNVLKNLLTNKAREKYFFEHLKYKKWFFSLKKSGFFQPEKAPGSEPTDEEGYYKVPYWNVLTYLEIVSQQVNNPDNEKYIDGL
ncbi:MAG: hypothetical protein H0Z24_09705, partial [Thermosipho sp. (in: Bacteria)]|nr:hypothetical protein [Thermosipho sp. (in: thermotogales)]